MKCPDWQNGHSSGVIFHRSGHILGIVVSFLTTGEKMGCGRAPLPPLHDNWVVVSIYFFYRMLLKKDGVETQILFLKFAREIAAGMSHLSQKSFVHRDLAARNVLLDESLTCKVLVFHFQCPAFCRV